MAKILKMKLYRHYKNKPYKILTVAKHSESLEDLVIYECRYDNELAKIWARPRDMFHGQTEVDGQLKPRFEKVPLEIETTTEITPAHIKKIAPLIENGLGEWNPETFRLKLKNKNRFHRAIALVDGKAVGFKMGYEDDRQTFYSWLGAVLKDYHGLGIADSLMKSQHDWCRQQGYNKVRTKTQNRYKAMLILNIKNGFEIIGTESAERDGLKILLEKKL